MREQIQLNYLREILNNYVGQEPFNVYLKQFFRQNKNLGSRDRKFYSSICYHFLRCNPLQNENNFESRLVISEFLFNPFNSEFQSFLQEKIELKLPSSNTNPFEKKLEDLVKEGILKPLTNYFPYAEKISSEIEKQPFFLSHFKQPLTWLKAKPGKAVELVKSIQASGLEVVQIDEQTSCIGIEQGTNLESMGIPADFFQIQDRSSQKTIEVIRPQKNSKIWDCCSGAGGKSLMIKDQEPSVELYASDARPEILKNLKIRFKQYGITGFKIAQVDLKKLDELVFGQELIPEGFFDQIVADVPCSGSGTWGRNPEWLSFFEGSKIEYYSKLQFQICRNAQRFLKTNGVFNYITCSVFADENEINVKKLVDICGLKLINQEYIKGYSNQADTMFAATLIKS